MLNNSPAGPIVKSLCVNDNQTSSGGAHRKTSSCGAHTETSSCGAHGKESSCGAHGKTSSGVHSKHLLVEPMVKNLLAEHIVKHPSVGPIVTNLYVEDSKVFLLSPQ